MDGIINGKDNPINIKLRNIVEGYDWDNRNHIQSLHSVIKDHCKKSQTYAALNETYLFIYDYNSFQSCDSKEKIFFIIEIIIAGYARFYPNLNKIIYYNSHYKLLMSNADEDTIFKKYL